MDKRPDAGHNTFRLLIIATAVTLVANVIFWSLPASFNKLVYGTIQFVWPSLSILALAGVYYATSDHNSKFASKFFAVALVPWTATLLMWSIVLPAFYNDDLAYKVSGFGFLCCYAILAYGLVRLKRSKQWYIPPSTDFFLNVITVIVIAGVTAFVLGNLDLASPRFPDIVILYLYLMGDIIILSYVVRLLYMRLGDDLKYLVLVIGGFVFVNGFADLIYELRWLFSMSVIFTVKTARVTDFVYNVSLVFMVAALVMYDSGFTRRALDGVNRKLRDTRYFMDNVVMQSPDAICICDPAGNVVLANDPFLRLFGVWRSDVIGKFNVFRHMSRWGDWAGSMLSKLMAGEAASMHRVSICLPGDYGGPAEVSVKAYPVLDEDNRISGYMLTVEDITERLSLEGDLLESKKQAELYVDLMAHDINNMNQVALGFMEMAEDKISSEGKLDADHMGLLLKPIESLKNSSRLIDNVRKLQKEKSGKLGTRPIAVDDVLSEVKKQYESVPGRSLAIDFKSRSGCQVLANDLLKEVFANLVGNAIKHSKSPLNINVSSRCVLDGGKAFCRVEIEDDGPGIPDDMKRQIFERLGNDRSFGLPRGKG